MKNNLLRRISRIGCVALLATLSAVAQDHKWAGRTLDDVEWTIHERMAALPFHGVFDTLRFELNGSTVTLSGQVVKESVKHNAERAVKRLNGVENVVNRIEVLPSSRRDDALRMKVYRAVYEMQTLAAADVTPSVHIIVKDGWVTLEGVVDSEAERSQAYFRALTVTAQLYDHLRVAPEQP